MKKFKVRFSVASTYVAEVLAKDEDDAVDKVRDGEFKFCESDGWEDDIEVFDVEEIEEDV